MALVKDLAMRKASNTALAEATANPYAREEIPGADVHQA
jgi:hypothetical protein